MTKVVGIRFRTAERTYFFDPANVEVACGDTVVVETDKGPDLGWVVSAPHDAALPEQSEPLKPLIRKANPADTARRTELRQRETEALMVAREKARALSLPMKFVDGRYTLDGGRLTLYFGAEQRVDFRQFLRTLGDALSVRVELRQIGARDEAKFAGGVGRCGRAICCVSWLTEFAPISVRMAKEQSLPINAEGLAGQCGRLRCCLRFEYEQYQAVNRLLPRINEMVNTPYGMARVIVGHPIKETVSVMLDEERVRELPLSEITRLPGAIKDRGQKPPAVIEKEPEPGEDEAAQAA